MPVERTVETVRLGDPFAVIRDHLAASRFRTLVHEPGSTGCCLRPIRLSNGCHGNPPVLCVLAPGNFNRACSRASIGDR